MKVEPREEHRWLQGLIGNWAVEMRASMEPGKPEETFKSTEAVTGVGDIWIQGKGESTDPDGSKSHMVMALGFDSEKGKFVGTFISSMMTNMWVYEGSLDAEKKVLTLDTVGPAMTPEGGTTDYQDSIELVSDDHRVLTSRMRMPDGSWNQFMRADYRRVK